MQIQNLSLEDLNRVVSGQIERIDRLEKLVESLYHAVELYNIEVPRLADVLIRYFPAMENYRKEINIMMRIHKGYLQNIEAELQKHFEHHSYIGKKTNKYKKYIS